MGELASGDSASILRGTSCKVRVTPPPFSPPPPYFSTPPPSLPSPELLIRDCGGAKKLLGGKKTERIQDIEREQTFGLSGPNSPWRQQQSPPPPIHPMPHHPWSFCSGYCRGASMMCTSSKSKRREENTREANL